MNNTAKSICKIAIIGALYVSLTLLFGGLSYGALQIRPAEAFTLLPLFSWEAVPALFIGCAVSNFASPYFFYDVIVGSLTSLLGAVLTYFFGKIFKTDKARIFFGGLPPVLLNALTVPLILFLSGSEPFVLSAYLLSTLYVFLSQVLCVYGLGVPLFFAVKKTKLFR